MSGHDSGAAPSPGPDDAGVDSRDAGRSGRGVAAAVLHGEAGALIRLAGMLDARFDAALDLLLAVRGRVVVTGIGKSGHIARKVASTLASTGTPAFFVHPVEASHGDLGMVGADDLVLALSNSGRTAELADIVSHAKRFGLKLVAVTARPASPLAQQADVVLALPDMPEACPMGLAPTTSTTMMLALGDALAIALLDRRGFSSDQFRVLHPGGSLGRRLVRVADIMHGGDAVPVVGAATPMREAILVMTAKSFGCVGVVDGEGRLAGIVTDGDLRRHMADGLLDRPAGEVMTRSPLTVAAGALGAEALAIMNGRQGPRVTSLFVTGSEGRIDGIVHIHDCLRAGVA